MKTFISFISFLILSLNGNAQLSKEQESIKKTFFDFLRFYQKNEVRFNSFRLYKGTGADNSPPYKIQWKEAERYFSYLRTSVPFVGEAYIKAERAHFKYNDSCFKDIAGVTVEFVGDKAVLKIGSELWEGAAEKDRSWSTVPFVKEKGKWKMADNIYPEEAPIQ